MALTIASPSEPRFITVSTNGKCNGSGCRGRSSSAQHREHHHTSIESAQSREQSSFVREKLDAAIEELIETRGDCHPDLLLSLVTIGNACSRNGDYEDAVRYYQQALPLNKKLNGPDHPKVGDNLVSMALAMEAIGYYEQGLESLEEALDIYKICSARTKNERKGNALWFKVVNAHNQLGNMHFNQGFVDHASVKYYEALKASGKGNTKPGDSCLSMHVADILNNIASVKAIHGEFEDSISTYHSALELQMHILGEDDPAIAITLNNIGTMNFHAKKYEVALKSYKQVLKMRREILGRNDPSVSDALVNIAITYKKKRDYGRAERALEESLRIARIHFAEDHEKIADIFVNLGLIAKSRGDTHTANIRFQKALAMYKTTDDEHPTIKSLHHLLNE